MSVFSDLGLLQHGVSFSALNGILYICWAGVFRALILKADVDKQLLPGAVPECHKPVPGALSPWAVSPGCDLEFVAVPESILTPDQLLPQPGTKAAGCRGALV